MTGTGTKINTIKELVANHQKEGHDQDMTIKPITADQIRQQLKEFLDLKDLLSAIESDSYL
ncbi:hypothetical protein ACFYKT_15160 [Cytobacillus sp. FJAT-53684]|uniref:Uncharacterized protein n=1 Tax=Cytobacillus mangrovibacter TaxID=3299024 RepID=A0ABW6K0I4_9BACI